MFDHFSPVLSVIDDLIGLVAAHDPPLLAQVLVAVHGYNLVIFNEYIAVVSQIRAIKRCHPLLELLLVFFLLLDAGVQIILGHLCSILARPNLVNKVPDIVLNALSFQTVSSIVKPRVIRVLRAQILIRRV